MFRTALAYSVLLAGVLSSRGALAGGVLVEIDVNQRGPAINPFIYGQFIEHLGRCIYGGIWAEMLEDRKFYFPVEEKYAPYKSLQDTAYPVVGASPWEIVGKIEGVAMSREAPFVGDHTPRLAGGAGLRQRDLGVVEGKKYVGYVWLKAAEGGAGPVEVSLTCGEDGAKTATRRIDEVGNEYEKREFSFVADATTDRAQLTIKIAGDKPVLVGTASLMPGDHVRGMRADTLALLKQLNAPLYRWPGGNFVSGYDWRDGLGPRDRRPPRKNPAWTGVEHNDVGLEEFLDFCREVNAEPMVAVNTGFGDDYSAAQQVEYCNSGAETIGGSWRAKNGRQEPHGVRYWCVGNEMFGPWQLGFMQLSHYTQKHNRCATAMRRVDDSIQLVGVGNLGGFNPKHDPDQRFEWSEGMLRDCRENMDMISEHFYEGRTPWGGETPDVVAKHVALLRDSIRKKAEGQRELQKKLKLLPDNMVPIAMDEWNYWHRDYKYGELGCEYDLADALGVAAGLHEYFRHSDIIQMANYAQTVNVIGCIKTTKTGAFMDTTALPLMVYRRHFGTIPVETLVEGGADLDVCAALTADGKALTVAVVNPRKEAAELEVKAAGFGGGGARQWVVAGDDSKATNDVEHARVQVQEDDVTFDGTRRVPGYGFAVLKIPAD